MIQQQLPLLIRKLPADLFTQRVVGVDDTLPEGRFFLQVIVDVALHVDNHPTDWCFGYGDARRAS